MSVDLTRRLFLRLLGVVYLAAFASLDWQVDGLLGPDGVLPADAYLARVASALGDAVGSRVPTVFWLDAGPGSLHLVCRAGIALALLLVAGLVPLVALALLWALYLSLVAVGQTFLSYQWDALLLETGFLAIFWAPLAWRLDAPSARAPSPIVLWLLRWLAFRLMFFSGWVKLASGDPAWWSLDALSFHYETQPLPAWTSWYAHQLPAWLQRLSCAWMFVVELALPPLIFLGRVPRLVACAGLVALQLLIAATGNYGFFNLLSIVLCVPLLDDGWLARIWPRRRGSRGPRRAERRWKIALDGLVAGLLLALSVPLSFAQGFGVPATAAPPVATLARALAPYHLVSSYGLFAVMTTSRPEIVLEGTTDGVEWRPYVFRWKPGPLARAPSFAGTNMPRLDWQMWFDALYLERMLASGRTSARLVTPALLARLREASPAVLALLAEDPFHGRRPRELRWRLWDYAFTDFAERRTTGDWWRRSLLYDERRG
ncbi:MAG: lipase maturation factor family protein [Thermodesulfobacteriota bacterium]